MINKDKKIKMSKKLLLNEHKIIIPELEKAGLKKEAEEQEKDLREIKSK